MKIRDVMTHDVEVIGPSDTLRDASEKMRALNVGVLPVCDSDRVVGMVTDRDIVVRGLALGKNLDSTISDVMSEDVEWCFEDRDVQEAAQLMKDKQIRRILVLDENKKLVGICSLGDIATERDDIGADVLERVSEPAVPAR
jgi:CBS domain-containing protein